MSEQRKWSDPDLAFEMWKEYAGIKDRMIQIATWLLAFSAGIIGFYATGKITKAQQALLWIGVLVSVIAAFTALLYGGYAARNWAMQLRSQRKTTGRTASRLRSLQEFGSSLDRTPPDLLARRNVRDRVAPVFWVFF